MARILFLCDSRDHAHDYGVDFLIQGAYNLYGANDIYEWPEKPSLHLRPGQDRDACQIDSDAWLPSKSLPLSALASMLDNSGVDAVIVTTPYGLDDGSYQLARIAARHSIPIAALNYTDEAQDARPTLDALGVPYVYFHRENPPPGAHPIWLSQPRSRVRPLAYKPHLPPRVMYVGTDHDWGADGTRQRMVRSIETHTLPHERYLDLRPGQTNRMTPEQYREQLWQSAVSVVWNSNEAASFTAKDSNRLWESLALGCFVIAERPSVPIPHLSSVYWVDSPEAIGPAVKDVITESCQACAGAEVQQAEFIAHHTSGRRLEYVLRTIGALGQ